MGININKYIACPKKTYKGQENTRPYHFSAPNIKEAQKMVKLNADKAYQWIILNVS